MLARGDLDRKKTKNQMLQDVSSSWQRPQIFDRVITTKGDEGAGPVQRKLEEISLPRVNFSGVPLSRVTDTLSSLSEEYDPAGEGVNIVVLDPTGADPNVNITLKRLALDRILDFIVESISYEYEVQEDAVVVRPGGEGSRLAG